MTQTPEQIRALQRAAAEKRTAEIKAKLPAEVPQAVSAKSPGEAYLDSISSGIEMGPIIKFTKGEFVTASDGAKVDIDADYIARTDQVHVGWIKFNDGAPPERVMSVWDRNFTMPPRESLGDTDESKWPIGLNGRAEDVWKHQMTLPLFRSNDGQLFTFVTTTPTGRIAVANLLRTATNMRDDALPVIRLVTGGYQHKDERIGWVETPRFQVTGRVAPSTLDGEAQGRLPME